MALVQHLNGSSRNAMLLGSARSTPPILEANASLITLLALQQDASSERARAPRTHVRTRIHAQQHQCGFLRAAIDFAGKRIRAKQPKSFVRLSCILPEHVLHLFCAWCGRALPTSCCGSRPWKCAQLIRTSCCSVSWVNVGKGGVCNSRPCGPLLPSIRAIVYKW